ncbi:response regulator [Bradyrhizobium sp. AZCC 2289]|uniref:response regulator n=1 Tax=Bradyrhizobium sp. AZCC 2289 TaxID=3117026 RepID=UPI002FF2053E
MRSLGYVVVHTFASAEEFLRSPHRNETSCVIADVRMSAMSGLELQAHLLASGQRFPFIFVTASSVESDRAQGFEGGSDLLSNQTVRRRPPDQMSGDRPGTKRRVGANELSRTRRENRYTQG